MKKLNIRIIFPLILLILAGVISYLNYVPGTWLTGWDTLHPELDLGLNFSRILSGVWREEQGVGAVAIHSHMSEIPRLVFLWISSLVLPVSFLRYLYFFVTLAIGPIGVYYFIRYAISKNKKSLEADTASFLGASFYLLNLTTLQHYFVPFEMFAAQFAFLPWLFYLALKYVNEGKRYTLLAFAIVSLLAAPMAYAATLFYTYFALITVFLFSYAVINKKKQNIKRAIFVLLASLMINAFWLTPNAYSVIYRSEDVSNSKINQIFTPEANLNSQAYGGLGNVLANKSFLFSWASYDFDTQEFDYLLGDWTGHLDRPENKVLSLVIVSTIVLGFALSIKKKNRVGIALISPLFLAMFFLVNSNLPTGFVYSYITNNISIIGEIFRNPFTKFSTILAFASAFYFAYFFYQLLIIINKNKFLKRWPTLVFSVAVLLGLVYYMLPAFRGQLISPEMKVGIPSSYFELFEWFDGQDNGRVAKLPVKNHAGWIYYDWGYQGAGFNWFGIKQPTFDRDFDRWSKENETFYHELSTSLYGCPTSSISNSQLAINNGNTEAEIQECAVNVDRVLEKYDVSYVLLDESIIAPGQDGSILRIPETKEMLKEIGAEIVFQKDFITVYKLSKVHTINTLQGQALQDSFVYAPEVYTRLQSDTVYSRKDLNYEGVDYINTTGSDTYPFSSIFKEKVDNVSYEGDSENIKVVIESDTNLNGGEMLIPSHAIGDTVTIPVEIRYFDKTVLAIFEPNRISVGDKEYDLGSIPSLALGTDKIYESVLVSVGKETFRVEQNGSSKKTDQFKVGDNIDIKVYSTTANDIDIADSFFNTKEDQCWTREGENGLVTSNVTGNTRVIAVKDAAACLSLPLTTLSEQSIVSVVLPFRSLRGEARPQFCIVRSGESECLNNDVYSNNPASNEWSEAKEDLVLPAGKYWMVVSVIPSDTNGVLREIEYRSPELSSYPLLNSSSYDPNVVWEDYVNEKRIDTGEISGPMILKIASKEDMVDLSATGNTEPKNCDLFERGSVGRQIMDAGIIYSADDRGAVCDYFELPSALTTQSYLMRFVGEGLSGRGSKFYLYNQSSGRNDLEILLPDTEFDESFAVLDWQNLESNNYTLNLETRSFGDISENRIDQISYYPISLDWIASIGVETESNGFGGLVGSGNSSSVTTNNVVVSNIKKTGTYKYTADALGSGLVILSQGYEDGWVAYAKKGILPILFGQRLEHLKVNGWANGFLLDDECEDTKCEIVIVYWPQYLQFIGFGLLFVTLGGLTYEFIRNGKRG